MNLSALNSVTLNGGVNDPIVRTRVESNCYAFTDTRSRVFVYTKVAGTPTAAVGGGLGRFVARPIVYASPRSMSVANYVVGRAKVGQIPVSATAKATTSTRAMVRSAVVSNPEANVSVNVWTTRAFVQAVGSASFQLVPRALRRSPVATSASAPAAVVPRLFYRVQVPATGHAIPTVRSTVYPRRHIRSSVVSQPTADAAVTFKVAARLVCATQPSAHVTVAQTVLRDVTAPVLLVARAYAQAVVTVLKVIRLPLFAAARAVQAPSYGVVVRSPVQANARAKAAVDISVGQQLRWDEEAPMDRRFKVNSGFFAFKVVS